MAFDKTARDAVGAVQAQVDGLTTAGVADTADKVIMTADERDKLASGFPIVPITIAGGTANALVGTTPTGRPLPLSQMVSFTPSSTNTDTASIAIDGNAPVALLDFKGAPLRASDLIAGARYLALITGIGDLRVITQLFADTADAEAGVTVDRAMTPASSTVMVNRRIRSAVRAKTERIYWGASGHTLSAWVGTSNQDTTSSEDNGYLDGKIYSFGASSNQGPITVNIDGRGVVALVTFQGDELQPQQLQAGAEYIAIYFDGKMRLLTPVKATAAQMAAGTDKAVQVTPALAAVEIDRRIAAVSATLPQPPRISSRVATGADGIDVAGGWSVLGSGTLSAETENVPNGSASVLRVTGAAGGDTTVVAHKRITPNTLLGKIESQIFVPRVSAGYIDVLIRWSASVPANDPPSAAPSGVRQIRLAPSKGIWTRMSADPSHKAYSTGIEAGVAWQQTQALPASIAYCGVEVFFSASVPTAERFVLVDDIAINGRAKSRIILGFDGMDDATADIALPLFELAGFRGYIACSGGAITANPTLADRIYGAGWDIISQAERLGDPAPGGYGTNQSTLAADIASFRAARNARGYARGDDIFAYPYNSRSAASDAVLSANGFHAARASGPPRLRGARGSSPLLAHGCLSTDNNTAVQMIAATEAAIAMGEDIWWYGHLLVESITNPALHTNISAYREYIEYLGDRAFLGFVDVIPPSQI